MLRLAFDFIITWRETRTRPNAYFDVVCLVDALDTEFNIVIDGIDILPENFSTIESIEALLKKNGVTE